MKILIDSFGGKRPRVADHLLQNEWSSTAINTFLTKGDLRAWRYPANVKYLTDSSFVSLFQYKEGTSLHWVNSSSHLHHVRSPVAQDSFERTYFTGANEPRVLADDIVSNPFSLATDYYKMGVKVPAAAPTFVSGSTGGSTYRAYVFTYVSRYGEEGPPSPVLSTAAYASGNVVLTGFTDPVDSHLKTATGTGANKPYIRLYRTNSSTDGAAAFQHVKDYDVSSFTWATGELTDDVADGDLGEVCPSVDWYPPPAALRGLVVMQNGSLAGYSGKDVYFSEPFLPHAWNPDYVISFSENILGLGTLGTAIVVVTDETQYLLYGAHPDSVTKQRLSGFYPCLSSKSIISTEYGVIYSSKFGLIIVSHDGLRVLTEEHLLTEDMDSYYPATMVGGFHDGKYYGFYHDTSSGERGGLVFNLRMGSLTDMSVYASATYASPDDGKFYVIVPQTGSSTNAWINEWEGDTINYYEYTWKSKLFLLDSPINFSVARIISDIEHYNRIVQDIQDNDYLIDLNEALFAGDLGGAINGAVFGEYTVNGDILYDIAGVSITPTITFTLYCNGVLKFTKQLEGPNAPFRLPSGYRGKTWQIKLSGFLPVRQVVLGQSMAEVAGYE